MRAGVGNTRRLSTLCVDPQIQLHNDHQSQNLSRSPAPGERAHPIISSRMTEEADPPATTALAAEDTGSTALSGVEGATQQPPTATSPPAASAAIGVSTTITADTATTSTSLSATAAASATVAAPIGDSDGSNSHECFLCCDEDSGLGRTYNVCRCHGMYVHIACQQKMLDAAVAMRGGPRLRCGACHGRYKNAKVLPTWRLSIIGALWCTCLVGVAVMCQRRRSSTAARRTTPS